MILARIITDADPLVRANVFDAFAGPGAPVGVASCEQHGESIVVRFDDERTLPALIDELIAIETTLVPARIAAFDDIERAVASAASGLNEPELDARRIIETYLA